jgi:hypothetical protein
MADKNPTDSHTAKANRTTPPKTQTKQTARTEENDPATNAGQNAHDSTRPPKPKKSQPTKHGRKRQCLQFADADGYD